MTRAGRDQHLPPSDRMVAFTDAAVAIALTLLVLPLVDIVPEVARTHEPPVTAVTEHLGQIGSFLLSFVVIARFWASHHRLFGYGHRLTRTLVQLNLVWVLTIAVLPFPTEMMALLPVRGFVVDLYLAVLVVCSGSLTAMAVLMRRNALADGDDEGVPESFVVGSLASTTTMVVALVVVLAVPALGPWALVILVADPVFTPVIRRLRGDGPASRTT
ncbi:TMEM175 family protein [Actinomycetospora sp. TBRC 11914]|uniref:TMEM175 family protein n=1 Tax=Actinomycetospora sp. TBRC 11914 TaxID=2729387 RepID=UPI00145F63CA|nr:TMEM175 family protein [Actinomycetospora sp. TBRC 11914]NMO93806.1 DUF1211 domain-containing protein [Actinomycetospora sp. TBRC 11914]